MRLSTSPPVASHESVGDLWELLRSERDCRNWILHVEAIASAALWKKVLIALETVWRYEFDNSAFQFHETVRVRMLHLRQIHDSASSTTMEAAQRRLNAYLRSVETLWRQRFFAASHFLEASELFTHEKAARYSAASLMQREHLELVVLGSKWILGTHLAEIQKARVSHMNLAWSILQSHELALEIFVFDAKRMWISDALTWKRKKVKDWSQLAELELIKYHWALLFRLEQAGRRHIIWQSLVRVCHMIESWERLYIIHAYARQTGEIAWLREQQGCYALIHEESDGRLRLMRQDEINSRRALVTHYLLHAFSAFGRRTLLLVKELVRRASLQAAMLSQLRALHVAIAGDFTHTRVLHHNHRHQRHLLCESELSARLVLEEALTTQLDLIALQWQQVDLTRLRDKAAAASLVSFRPFYESSDSEHDAAADFAWEAIYQTPQVPPSAFSSTRRLTMDVVETRSTVMSSPQLDITPPQLSSAIALARRQHMLTLSTTGPSSDLSQTADGIRMIPVPPQFEFRSSGSPSHRSLRDSPLRIAQNDFQPDLEGTMSDDSGSSSDAGSIASHPLAHPDVAVSSPVLLFEHNDVSAFPSSPKLFGGTRPFLSGTSKYLLSLDMVAVKSDEASARSVLAETLFEVHLGVLLCRVLIPMEDAFRHEIVRETSCELTDIVVFMSNGIQLIQLRESERSRRSHIRQEAFSTLSANRSMGRLLFDEMQIRDSIATLYHRDHPNMLGQFCFVSAWDRAVLIAREALREGATLESSLESETLRIHIMNHEKSVIAPVLKRLREGCDEQGHWCSDSTPSSRHWYDEGDDEDAHGENHRHWSDAVAVTPRRRDAEGSASRHRFQAVEMGETSPIPWMSPTSALTTGIDEQLGLRSRSTSSSVRSLHTVSEESSRVVVPQPTQRVDTFTENLLLRSDYLATFDECIRQEHDGRAQVRHDAQCAFVEFGLQLTVASEEMLRLHYWLQWKQQWEKVCLRYLFLRDRLAIGILEQRTRDNILRSSRLLYTQCAFESQRLALQGNECQKRRFIQRDIGTMLLNLKADILFTIFYGTAVALARAEDERFQLLEHHEQAEVSQILDKRRLYFGLRLSDGILMPAISTASHHVLQQRAKEMYYHIRVIASSPPARPAIQPNDIILAVQGVQVVTLSALKQALRLIKSNVAHITILRAKDGVTTTVSVKGVYRGGSHSEERGSAAPSRAQSL